LTTRVAFVIIKLIDKKKIKEAVIMGDNYDSSSIETLEGVEHVRRRPEMYAGKTDGNGKGTARIHTVWELVSNSVDEASNGFCDKIIVRAIEDNTIEVEDNGRGIPIDKHKSGKNSLEVVLTELNSGGKFDDSGEGAYSSSGGLHGVGASVTMALSEKSKAVVHRANENKKAYQKYKKGKPEHEVKVKEYKGEKQGTKIRFTPDLDIFDSEKFNFDDIKDRLEILSYLLPETKFYFIDERGDEIEEICFSSDFGISEYINDITDDCLLDENFHARKDHTYEGNNYTVDISFNFEEDSTSSNILSFVNNIKTEGGTHISGFKSSFTRAFNEVQDTNFSGADLRSGLNGIVSITLPDPSFKDQTKTSLTNPEARTVTSEVIYDEIIKFLQENPGYAEEIENRAKKSRDAREAAKEARDAVQGNSDKDVSMTLSSKLSDCTKRAGSNGTELFIVEGDSAGGSAKMARNKELQAILPLKGKPKNCRRSKPKTYLKNDEIKSIVTAVGTGVNADFNLDDLRYEKIIIMCDPDPDGLHIQSLLITLFFESMKPLIDEGVIHVAQPPLYYTKTANNVEYLYGEQDTDEYNDVRRFKGLGEMNPEELWKTTMDPETRRLVTIKANDNEATDDMIERCMGRSVKPRREIIQEYSKMETDLFAHEG
jgi:DNA gyrase subunit B